MPTLTLTTHAPTRQDGNKARLLKLPDHLVQFILERFPELSALPGRPVGEETCGWEAYIRVYRRLYNLLAGSDQPIYKTSDPTKDERLAELTDIETWTDLWHEYIRSSEATKHFSKEEKARLQVLRSLCPVTPLLTTHPNAPTPTPQLHSMTSSRASTASWRRFTTLRSAMASYGCWHASSTRTHWRACSAACDRCAHATATIAHAHTCSSPHANAH